MFSQRKNEEIIELSNKQKEEKVKSLIEEGFKVIWKSNYKENKETESMKLIKNDVVYIFSYYDEVI